MKQRAIDPTPQENVDYKLSVRLESYVSRMDVRVGATFKNFSDEEFILGGVYRIKDNIVLSEFRRDQRFIEIFPFEGAPNLYSEELLEQYHIIELCEKYRGTSHIMDNVKILLSKNRVFVFVMVDNGRPSKVKLKLIKTFCDKKGIEWLPADWLIVKHPDLFED